MKQAIILLVNGSDSSGQIGMARDNAIKALYDRHISATGLTLDLNNPDSVIKCLGRIAWFSRDVLDPKALSEKGFDPSHLDAEEEMGLKIWWKKEGMPSLKKFAKDVWKGTDAK